MLKWCPDDGFVAQIGQFIAVLVGPIRHEALDAHDVDRFIQLAATASRLAVAVANPAAHRWKRVFAPDGPVRVGVAFLLDEGDVAHGALVGWAGGPAGRHAFFIDGKRTRYGLRGKTIGRFSFGETMVELVADFHGTNRDTIPTSGAFGFIHVARLMKYLDLVIADIARDGLNLAVGHQVNVWVASHGHHFR